MNQIEAAAQTRLGVMVVWSDGVEDELPAVWLRHNCRCAECHHPNGQRLFDLTDIDVDIDVEAARVDADTLHVDLGGHAAIVPIDVLAARRREPADPSTWRASTWTARHRDSLLGDADDYSSDLTAAKQQLATHGIALIRNVPTRPGTVLECADRLGFVRRTNYGELFDVVAEPDPNNLAYTALGLPLHTDNPYRDPVPTVQLLHCLQAGSDGGESQFADGFHSAEHLRTEAPDDFAALTGNDVVFRFADDSTDLRARVPVIETDNSGAVTGVRLNSRSLAAIDLDTATTIAFYAALRRFIDLVSAPQHIVEVKLEPGDLVAFDNRRVLHGRSEYDVTDRRHLQGCYIDIDAVRSDVLVASR